MYLAWRPHVENHALVHEEMKAQRDVISSLSFRELKTQKRQRQKERKKQDWRV